MDVFILPFVKKQTGFSQIIDFICKEKKLLVGHNCFGDLVRIFQLFIADLPPTYEEFKLNLQKR